MNKYESMGKVELREACKEASIPYGKMTVIDMRAALGRVAAAKSKRRVAAKGDVGSKVQREERNGVKMPGPGACREVWEYLSKHGDMMPAAIKAVAASHGWNENNASIELYQWRRFHGVKRAPKTV